MEFHCPVKKFIKNLSQLNVKYICGDNGNYKQWKMSTNYFLRATIYRGS